MTNAAGIKRGAAMIKSVVRHMGALVHGVLLALSTTRSWQALSRAARHVAEWLYAAFLPREPALPQDPASTFMSARDIIAKGRIVMLLFFVVFLGWAALAPLDSAILAPGVIVVESHRKAIQHLEGGIVRKILVKDGENVVAGQLLIQLEDTQALANLDLLKGQNDALAAQEARLISERDAQDRIAFPASLTTRAADAKAAEAMRGEETTFTARRQTLGKQIEILNQRSGENDRIIAGLQSQKSAVEHQAELINQEIASVQTLYSKGLTTLPRLLALQRQAAELDGQRGQLVEKIAEIRLSSGENQLQTANLRNQQLNDVTKELRDVQTRHFDMQDRIAAAADILARLNLRAPVGGKIVGLSVHSSGAVIQPGETLMEIVPRKDALEVEARVRPEDADGVRVGMSARINLSAYDQRRMPMIPGIVSNVSADRLVDQRSGQAYFAVQLTVDRAPLTDEERARIMPGLPVEVSIGTGARTALEYFVEPITDVFRRGMRER